MVENLLLGAEGVEIIVQKNGKSVSLTFVFDAEADSETFGLMVRNQINAGNLSLEFCITEPISEGEVRH